MKIYGRMDSVHRLNAKIIPEYDDDIWVLWNVIAQDDELTMTKQVRQMGTGKRIHEVISIEINKAIYNGETASITYSGPVREGTKNISKGTNMKHEIKLGRPADVKFTLFKQEFLDQLQLKMLYDAKADVSLDGQCILLLMKRGKCLFYSYRRGRIKPIAGGAFEKAIPKNQLYNKKHDVAIQKFFSAILDLLLNSITWQHANSLLIAGPGKTKEDFLKFLTESQDQLENMKSHEDNKDKRDNIAEFQKRVIESNNIMIKKLPTISSDDLEALVLTSPEVMSFLNITMSMHEASALADFYEVMSKTPDKACYGAHNVAYALDQKLISTLIVSDRFYRSPVESNRAWFEKITHEAVKRKGLKLFLAQKGCVTEESVYNLGGFAAILVRDVLDSEYPEEPVNNDPK